MKYQRPSLSLTQIPGGGHGPLGPPPPTPLITPAWFYLSHERGETRFYIGWGPILNIMWLKESWERIVCTACTWSRTFKISCVPSTETVASRYSYKSKIKFKSKKYVSDHAFDVLMTKYSSGNCACTTVQIPQGIVEQALSFITLLLSVSLCAIEN